MGDQIQYIEERQGVVWVGLPNSRERRATKDERQAYADWLADLRHRAASW